MMKKETYETPEVYMTSMYNEGVVASSMVQDSNLESLDIIEEEW